VVFLQKYDILGFSRFSGIILLKKNPWNRFTATWIGLTARIKPSESLFLDLISTAYLGADGYDGLVLDSSAPAKSGAGRRYGRRRWGAPSSSYATSFSKPKAPTQSRWWEVSILTTYRGGGPRTAGDGEVARLVLGDGEGGLLWSFGSQDMRQGFLELPSSFSTDQLL
jgi:hypothetical protein